MKKPDRIISELAMLVVALVSLGLVACPAKRPTPVPPPPPVEPSLLLCGPGQTAVAPVLGGQYLVQKNEYNSSEPMCLTVYPNTGAWEISSAARLSPTGVAACPSSVWGCIGNGCTKDYVPAKVSALASLGSDVTFTPSTDSKPWDMSFDIWTSPHASNPDFSPGLEPGGVEIMITLAHHPSWDISTSQKNLGAITINDVIYDVYSSGMNTSGQHAISYVARTQATEFHSDLKFFLDDCRDRGICSDDQYLISVQFMQETWGFGVGSGVKSFSVAPVSVGGVR